MITQFKSIKNIRIGYIELSRKVKTELLDSICLTPSLELNILYISEIDNLYPTAENYKPKYTTEFWQKVINQYLVDVVFISLDTELILHIIQKSLNKNLKCVIFPSYKLNTLQSKQIQQIQDSSLNKIKIFNHDFDTYKNYLISIKDSFLY
jgi:hypothetical protein